MPKHSETRLLSIIFTANWRPDPKTPKNKKLLETIADNELAHYRFWEKLTGLGARLDRFRIILYYSIARLLGLNFGLALMEHGEESAQAVYHRPKDLDPQVEKVIADEERHEQELLEMIESSGLRYTGSVILGLNDALVELTGALAGLTLAFQNARLIALAGLITGIAASFWMATLEYLATREEGGKDPLTASVFTGLAYIGTVLLLVAPYFIASNPLVSLGGTLSMGLVIIAIFTFYISVARNESFKRKFVEMALISLGVAALSCVIGLLVRRYLNLEV